MTSLLEITLLASQTLPNFKAFVTKEQQMEHFGSVIQAEMKGYYELEKFRGINDRRKRKNETSVFKR